MTQGLKFLQKIYCALSKISGHLRLLKRCLLQVDINVTTSITHYVQHPRLRVSSFDMFIHSHVKLVCTISYKLVLLSKFLLYNIKELLFLYTATSLNI